MGDIRVTFTATRRKKRLQGKALVDNGAQTSMLGLNDACRLGLDIARAKKVDRETAGGLLLSGLRLRGVHVEANGRTAKLDDVFVPIAQEIIVGGREVSRPVGREQEPLLGQDFLQASNSFLDFENDTLLGIETLGPPISLSRKERVRPASKEHRELIRALATCPVPKRKRR